MKLATTTSSDVPAQDDLYARASASYGAALQRLVRAYEADPEKRQDLLQEIHIALWQSFAGFDQRCSLRTWVYRVAHNVGSSHVLRERRMRLRTVVESKTIEMIPDKKDFERLMHEREALEQLLAFIEQLQVPDRQLILCYLEGMDAASIAEITGLSTANIATKIHRIKNILARQFSRGGTNG